MCSLATSSGRLLLGSGSGPLPPLHAIRPSAALRSVVRPRPGSSGRTAAASVRAACSPGGHDPKVAFVGDAFPTAGQSPLEVRTADGRLLKLLVSPSTTIGTIRKVVADQTRTAASQVRLAYAGKELSQAQDDDVFVMKPDNNVMHTMQRMRGGDA